MELKNRRFNLNFTNHRERCSRNYSNQLTSVSACKKNPFSENVTTENGDGHALVICKVEFTLVQAMDAQNGIRYIVLIFL
jgi:hypothetical protein